MYGLSAGLTVRTAADGGAVTSTFPAVTRRLPHSASQRARMPEMPKRSRLRRAVELMPMPSSSTVSVTASASRWMVTLARVAPVVHADSGVGSAILGAATLAAAVLAAAEIAGRAP